LLLQSSYLQLKCQHLWQTVVIRRLLVTEIEPEYLFPPIFRFLPSFHSVNTTARSQFNYFASNTSPCGYFSKISSRNVMSCRNGVLRRKWQTAAPRLTVWKLWCLTTLHRLCDMNYIDRWEIRAKSQQNSLIGKRITQALLYGSLVLRWSIYSCLGIESRIGLSQTQYWTFGFVESRQFVVIERQSVLRDSLKSIAVTSLRIPNQMAVVSYSIEFICVDFYLALFICFCAVDIFNGLPICWQNQSSRMFSSISTELIDVSKWHIPLVV
jgi:hypothetical protein